MPQYALSALLQDWRKRGGEVFISATPCQNRGSNGTVTDLHESNEELRPQGNKKGRETGD